MLVWRLVYVWEQLPRRLACNYPGTFCRSYCCGWRVSLFYLEEVFLKRLTPLLFLFLVVPLPSSILDRIAYYLQVGSAWITGAVFDLLRVPALRDGLVFHLARVSIEVAKECSGIRSSMVLLILALVIVHLCLKRFWTKVLFVASGLFMMILKNGIRIATLTILAIYVDPGFLYGRLHHQGGIAFFLFALLLLVPVLRLLQRSEALGARNSTVVDKISRGCA